MSITLDIILNNITPIFLVAGLGFVLRRVWRVETRPLSRATFYVLSPCLLFSGLINAELTAGALGQLMLFTLALVSVMGVIGWGFGRILRLPQQEMVVLMLAAMFSNAGNFGLSINQLRYGDEGIQLAIPYFVATGIIMYTVGVVVASSGKQTIGQSLRGLLRLPIFYAAIITLPIVIVGIPVPQPFVQATTIAGSGAIPLMLLVLGMQLADVRGLSDLRVALPASLIRLGIAPLVALTLATLIGLDGLGRSVSLIQASLPTAVATTIITTEFDANPQAMTTTVVLSTILSPITLVLVIGVLGL